ncbi:MAG: hypothetical protein FJW37_10030 [Acidobacteria bacterium]|nr:hypothetical protein [Acidobacteriota bacterium]
MAGYLDQYGAGYEQRARVVKWVVFSLLAALIGGGVLYFVFRNYRQEVQGRRFLRLLEEKNYPAAYALWGCTEAAPCPNYPFDRFLHDWGPDRLPSGRAFEIVRTRACGSGVILTVNAGGRQEEQLWVERKDLTIAFSPWPGCPPGR